AQRWKSRGQHCTAATRECQPESTKEFGPKTSLHDHVPPWGSRLSFHRSGSLRSRLNIQRDLSVYRLPFEIDIRLGSKAPVYGLTRLCPSFLRAPHGSRQVRAVPTARIEF